MQKRDQYYNLISVIAGVLFGLFFPCFLPIAKGMSVVFVRLMQCLAVPLIFFSLVSTILNMEQKDQLKRIFGLTLYYTFLTTIFAAFLAVIVYLIFNPAQGVEGIDAQPIALPTSYQEALLALIPKNIFDVFIEGNVIGAVAFAVLVGTVGHRLSAEQRSMLSRGVNLFSTLFLSFSRYIVQILPWFLWAFAMLFVEDLQNGLVIQRITKYISAVFLTNALHAFVLLPLLLKFKGFSFVQTWKKALPTLSVAALSKSSAVAIPTTLSVCTEGLKVRKETARFTVPICATINMNGCAVFILLTSFFMIEVYQGAMPLWTMIAGVFIATIVAVGNAGVPMGCFFMTLSLLTALGVPTQMMGVLLPIFAILDMFETGINVWSDVVITRCIDKDLQKNNE